jgi:hypothetical protein
LYERELAGVGEVTKNIEFGSFYVELEKVNRTVDELDSRTLCTCFAKR